MAWSVQGIVALGTLLGFLGTSAPRAATALHVLFEHATPHRVSGHAHASGGGPAGHHAHPHESTLEGPEHPDTDAGQVRSEDVREHRHALSEAAELLPRASRLLAELSAAGLGGTVRVPTTLVDRSPLLVMARAGPPPTSVSLSRRAVVLQI